MSAEIGTAPTVTPATGESSGGSVVYYVTTEDQATALKDLKVSEDIDAKALFTVTKISDSRWEVTLADTSTTADTIAARLNTIKDSYPFGDGNKSTSETASSGGTGQNKNDASATLTVNGAGYYLITSSLGSKIAVETLGDVTIDEKNGIPSVTKTQNDTGTSAEYKSDRVNVAVGDTIYYQTVVFVPTYASSNLTLTDIMSAGLTPPSSSDYSTKVTATVSSDGTSYSALANDNDANWSIAVAKDDKETELNGFAITIKPTDATKGKYIKFLYTATVNSNAVTTDTTKVNTATLVYSHYTDSSSVYYDTYATGAVKYDGDTATEASGVLTAKDGSSIAYLSATFKLQKSSDNGSTWTDVNVTKDATNGYYYIGGTESSLVSDATTGQIIIRGLDNDVKYQLVETKAPTGGYASITSDQALTLTKDEKTKVAITSGEDENTTYLVAANVKKIANYKSSALPSTGGAGRFIYMGFGAAGLALVIALLTLKKRKRV